MDSDLELKVLSIDDDMKSVVIRTNCGRRAAERLARFELSVAEVFISTVFWVPTPPDHPGIYDYIFTTQCGKRPVLPEKEE